MCHKMVFCSADPLPFTQIVTGLIGATSAKQVAPEAT
jgi:hypothetical protein